MIELDINRTKRVLDVAPDTPMLWVLRDHAQLTGTKFGCGAGLCGACTVLVDGVAQRSCQITAGECTGKQVLTIEGVRGPIARAVQKAWQDLDVAQCGYCQSGQIMTTIGLFVKKRQPSEAEINSTMDTLICRCGTYARIKQAITAAAKAIA